MTIPTEYTIRRRAQKLGLQLQKSRSQNVQWPGFGTYRVLSKDKNEVVFGGIHDTYGTSLADCATYIASRLAQMKHDNLMKTKTKKAGAKKLYWGQSQLAWLVGTKPIDNSGVERDKKSIERLFRRLLTIGGDSICVPFGEPIWWNELLTQHGELLKNRKVILKLGEPSNCQTNSLRIWKKDKNKYTLFKGYGLSEDNMWRWHWWLVDTQGNIIETTEGRLYYFGFPYNSHSMQELLRLAKTV